MNHEDLRDILSSCDRSDPAGDVKGFWRVDKEKPAELRQTVLTMVAFSELQCLLNDLGDAERGQDSILTSYHEEWLSPEKLRLTDYELGDDERATKPQLVAPRLGPRFIDWQLVQNAEESWGECHVHARSLLGAKEYARLLKNAGSTDANPDGTATSAPGREPSITRRLRLDGGKPRTRRSRQSHLFE